jgi:hypothetical protein
MPGSSPTPSGAQWVGSYFPGMNIGYDASSGMGSIPLPGGAVSFDTKNYPVVNGRTQMTPDQVNGLMNTAPYDPNAGVNQAGLGQFMGMMQGAMSPYESALKAQEQQQAGFYNDLAGSQVNQAQAAGDTARNNLQTDEGNQWQSAASSGQGRGVGGGLSAYEQSKVSKDYAPQFESLEQNQAANIGNIRLQASQAIQALQSQGLTEDAQNLSSLTEQGIGWLQTTASATQQERDAVLNRLIQETQNATQNQQFEESQKQQQQQFQQSQQQQQAQFEYPYSHTTPYDLAYINMQTGKDSPTALKQQSQQATGSAEQTIAYQANSLAGQYTAAYKKQYGHDPTAADMTKIQQQVMKQIQNGYITQNTGAWTTAGVSPDDMANYAAQVLGQPSPYKGTIGQVPTSDTTIMSQAVKLAQTDPNWLSATTPAEQQAIINQYAQMLQNQGSTP